MSEQNPSLLKMLTIATQVSLANAQMETDISKFNETMDQQREQFL